MIIELVLLGNDTDYFIIFKQTTVMATEKTAFTEREIALLERMGRCTQYKVKYNEKHLKVQELEEYAKENNWSKQEFIELLEKSGLMKLYAGYHMSKEAFAHFDEEYFWAFVVSRMCNFTYQRLYSRYHMTVFPTELDWLDINIENFNLFFEHQDSYFDESLMKAEDYKRMTDYFAVHPNRAVHIKDIHLGFGYYLFGEQELKFIADLIAVCPNADIIKVQHHNMDCDFVDKKELTELGKSLAAVLSVRHWKELKVGDARKYNVGTLIQKQNNLNK